MSLCKAGQISNCCLPNGLMTLTEYLEDYAGEETKKLGTKIVESELLNIPNEKSRKIAKEQIEYIKTFNKSKTSDDEKRKRVEI